VKFSVITVTYNNLQGLLKTSESILEQTFGEFEWIIVDGGSADGTSFDCSPSAPMRQTEGLHGGRISGSS
jgi:GT2 family glycosyltransferase